MSIIPIQSIDLLIPPAEVSSRDWLPTNILMPAGTETGGLPFSFDSFPHADGIVDAFDNPNVRQIVLQWGTRLGKTTTCLSLMAKVASTKPRNMMFSGPTKDASGRVVSTRLYPLLRTCNAINGSLPALGHQGKFFVDLKACRIYVGWSGSESSLADVGAWFAVANEVDKWSSDSSEEADPLELFLNRVKGFSDHKVILESTPTLRGSSRVERALYASNRHDRYVPCPHCGEYQILVKGDGESPGGIKWDKSAGGKSDPDVAFATAFYECSRCLGRIEDYHRVPMLRRGVWCPEGATVDTDGQIVGDGIRAGSDRYGFGPLASWYSTIERWGNFARAWVESQGNPRKLQDVFNSYMAITWEVEKKKHAWNVVVDRLRCSVPRGVVPLLHSVVTVGIDKQAEHFVYVVVSWGPERASHVIEYGVAETLDEITREVISRAYAHEDGGRSVMPSCTLVDSGYAPTEAGGRNIYEFANNSRREGLSVYPCKGSSTSLTGPYRIKLTERGTAMPGQKLVHVDTRFSQEWIERQIHTLRPGDPGSLTIYMATDEEHQDFVEQILNDAKDGDSESWDRIDPSIPNDYRDAKRYADVAMLLHQRNSPIRPRSSAAAADKPAASKKREKSRPRNPIDSLLTSRPRGWIQ